ncbi:hypothetical protein FRB90_003564 [Tulasnella sp. 427]|nr:hypothetical protein FRB90_003564 [Tulasnella sp. 427]
MANYVQFPSSGAPPSGQYMSYGPASPVPAQPTGNVAGAGGYGAVYPTSNQAFTNPGGSPLQPGSPRPGTQAYMNMRLPDGSVSYVPVVAQMVGGRMQWITAGPAGGQPPPQASPRGGETIQAQRTGYDAQAAYPDPYRAAERERETAASDRKWYQSSSKKDKSSKKWEREARAREEAEERQRLEIAERERIRKLSNNLDRSRRASVSASAEGPPSGILRHSTSGRDLGERFGSMSLGPNGPYQSASTRSRRPSTSEAENPYQRARRLSTGVAPDGHTGGDYTRQRRPSGNYGAPTTPAGVSAFFPDRERALGRNDYGSPHTGHGRSASGNFPMPGTLPASSYVAPDGSGRIMGGGMIVQPTGYGNPSAVMPASPETRSAPPMSFYREPSRSVPYPRFDPFSILWDLGDFRKFSPPLPALLVPCDVLHDDWNRCIQDLSTAWTGALPYDIFNSPRKRQQNRHSGAATPASGKSQLVRPSSAIAKTIDIWNASFFYGRKLELILYRGLERRSGLTAGRKSERLKRSAFPPQFQAILYGRYPKRRQHHDSEDDTDDDSDESLTSSSESDSSSSDEESYSDDDDRSDDEPAYVTKHRDRRAVGSHQAPHTPHMSRSRRNSLAAHGQLVPANAGLDVHEMWAVKSREAVKVIRARQKIEKKRRKMERRMKRRELRGEPLYSLWIVHL